MKITQVRACQPIADNSPADWRTSIGQILVAVDTDAGLTGYGVGGGGLAGIHVIHTVLRDLLTGRDAEPVEDLWQAMYAATLPFGQKGIAIMAVSGVDLALWDLRGKSRNKSVARLLSEEVRDDMPCYITVWADVTPELAQQFSAFKLHVEQSPDPVRQVLDRVRRTRDLIGPDPQLMVDAWMRWDLATTLEVAERIAPYGVGWIEEPLPADDTTGYAELCKRSPVPIAGGEHEFTAAAFRELIDRQLHHVLQPDVCWCGGMTELVKIYQMAEKAGMRVCPHRGAELWGLHAVASLDPNPLAESGRPWMTWVGGQPAIESGRIKLNDDPGFGVQIADSLAHFDDDPPRRYV